LEEPVQIMVNGEDREFSGKSITNLLADLGITPAQVAVELNLNIIPKNIYETTDINPGDRIEIVHFVGGG
jgi:thiamine biosynthesis protein ThiS